MSKAIHIQTQSHQIFLLFATLFFFFCAFSTPIYRNSLKTCRKVFFLFSFSLHLSDPCFCCVTDDFNYLLTPCTQQIHMINGPGGCCNHHLDGAKESKQLFSTVILKTATTAGGDCRCTKGERETVPVQIRLTAIQCHRGHIHFSFLRLQAATICLQKKKPISPQQGERLLQTIDQQIAAFYMEIVVKEMKDEM